MLKKMSSLKDKLFGEKKEAKVEEKKETKKEIKKK